MGTRSLTHIYDNETLLVTIYRQFDGYPAGHGKEIARTVADGKFVNGITDNNANTYNGAGCFAASLIMKLKAEIGGPGGVYIYPPGASSMGEEYVYDIHVFSDLSTAFACHGYENFEGSAANFIKWVDSGMEMKPAIPEEIKTDE